MQGKVIWFDKEKGYGFLQSAEADNNGKGIFVHQTGINMNGFRFLTDGQEVEFDLDRNDRGLIAVNVVPV